MNKIIKPKSITWLIILLTLIGAVNAYDITTHVNLQVNDTHIVLTGPQNEQLATINKTLTLTKTSYTFNIPINSTNMTTSELTVFCGNNNLECGSTVLPACPAFPTIDIPACPTPTTCPAPDKTVELKCLENFNNLANPPNKPINNEQILLGALILLAIIVTYLYFNHYKKRNNNQENIDDKLSELTRQRKAAQAGMHYEEYQHPQQLREYEQPHQTPPPIQQQAINKQAPKKIETDMQSIEKQIREQERNRILQEMRKGI